MMAGIAVARPIKPRIFDPNEPLLRIRMRLNNVDIDARKIAATAFVIVALNLLVRTNVRPRANGPPITTHPSIKATRYARLFTHKV